MDVRELRHLANNRKDVLIFNPLMKDLEVIFADHEPFILKAGEITSVKGDLYEGTKKKLVNFIINERDLDPLADKDGEISKEVEVNL
jgi:hypothetical protein